MFGFMPFRTEPATPAVINRIMKENGIPPQYTSNMQQVYYNLPVVEMQSLITTLQHLITAFIPGFAANHVSISIIPPNSTSLTLTRTVTNLLPIMANLADT